MTATDLFWLACALAAAWSLKPDTRGDVMSYRIVRMYQDSNQSSRIIKRGLTLEEAQEHCSDDETSSSTCTTQEGLEHTKRLGHWFDGYEEAH